MAEQDRAAQTPLIDLLRAVPKDAGYDQETREGGYLVASRHHPVGRYCQEAADNIEAAEAIISLGGADWTAVKEERLKSLESDNAQKDGRIAELESERDGLESLNKYRKAESKAFSEHFKTQRAQYASLEQQIKRGDLREWMTNRTQELVAKNERISKLEQSSIAKDERIAELWNDFNDLNGQYDDTLVQIKEKCQSIDEMTAHAVTLRQEINGLNETLSLQDDLIVSLQTGCKDKDASIKSQAEEIERLKAKDAERDERAAGCVTDLHTLADAVLQAKGTLENDLYRTRVKNCHDILEEVNDTAINWMSEP